MKQLYFTSCLAGRSVGGASGFQVRAATPGLDPGRIKAALRYVGYMLHPTVVPDETTAQAAPVRLALLDTPDVGRLFLRARYVGKDPGSGRYGNFFTHLLLDVPESFDGAQAVACWESPFWRDEDGDFGVDLDEVTTVPPGRDLNDAALARLLAHDVARRMLTFALAAHLADGDGRIYLVAPAEEIALCAFGIARLAPPELAKWLTFSTYEHEPLSCYARLVGACWPAGAAVDLPSSCYLGSGRSFNRFNGHQTPLPTADSYAEFAVNAAAEGDWAAIDRVRDVASRLGVAGGDLLEIVFRLETEKGEATREVITRALGDPKLAPWIVSRRPGVAARIVTLASDDPDFGKDALPRTLTALRDGEARAGLLRSIANQGAAFARAGDVRRTRNLLDGALTSFSPDEAAAVREGVFDAIKVPDGLPWEMWAYLLHQIPARDEASKNPTIAERRRRWLTPPAEQLAPLLALDLAGEDKVLACCETIRRDGEPGPHLVRALADRRPLALDVLDFLANDLGGAVNAVRFFEAMMDATKADDLLDEMVRRGSKLPAQVLDACLVQALKRGRLDAARLVETHGPSLVPLLEGGVGLGLLVDHCLALAGADSRTLEFLHDVAKTPSIDEARRERIRPQVSLATFLKKPSLDITALQDVANAIRQQPTDARQRDLEQKVLGLVVEQLLRLPKGEDAGVSLEHAIGILGPINPKGPAEVYLHLLRLLMAYRPPWKRRPWKRPDLLSALLGVALGQFRTGDLPHQFPQLDQKARIELESEARGLVRLVARRGGPKAIEALNRRIEAEPWSSAAAAKWGRIRLWSDEQPAHNLVFEILSILVGMLLVIITFFLGFLLWGRGLEPRPGMGPEREPRKAAGPARRGDVRTSTPPVVPDEGFPDEGHD